jgi:hypothetical protein
MASFVKMGRDIQDILQSVEEALIEAGFDDFVVATNRGSFHWQMVERARAETAKDE